MGRGPAGGDRAGLRGLAGLADDHGGFCPEPKRGAPGRVIAKADPDADLHAHFYRYCHANRDLYAHRHLYRHADEYRHAAADLNLDQYPAANQDQGPPTKATRRSSSAGWGAQDPSDIKADQRWVDVDLTHQRAYAYQGTQVVRSFIVSTGISIYPTVTGQYHIYVKYRYADMRGVGWFLPDVPYTMYFYKGYGLHGTYWHHNFGTPMSHGCVNMKTEDAAWLFDFASVGTLVNIHY